MQLKETLAGEVTVWLAEMAVTMGATGDEEEAEEGERRYKPQHGCLQMCVHLTICGQ